MTKDGFSIHLHSLCRDQCLLSKMSDSSGGQNRLAFIKVFQKVRGYLKNLPRFSAFLRTRTVPQLECDGRFYRGFNMKVIIVMMIITMISIMLMMKLGDSGQISLRPTSGFRGRSRPQRPLSVQVLPRVWMRDQVIIIIIITVIRLSD